MIDYLMIAVGFCLLIKGADYLVEGASGLAKLFKVSDLVVGLTLVALGTSAPELFVNIFASVKGNTSIAIGNVLGSNIFNLLVVLGSASLMSPVIVTKSTIWREIPFSVVAVLILVLLANTFTIGHTSVATVGRLDGILLLGCFMLFLWYIFHIARASDVEEIHTPQAGMIRLILWVIMGIAALAFGGKIVVEGAIHIAERWHVSQEFIGLTIVATGTSLPELVTSVVAAHKRKSDIAVGNVVGSNIANIFLILGVSALINPLALSPVLNVDILVLLLASSVLFIFMFTGEKHKIDRWEGVLFLVMYMGYMSFLLYRK